MAYLLRRAPDRVLRCLFTLLCFKYAVNNSSILFWDCFVYSCCIASPLPVHFATFAYTKPFIMPFLNAFCLRGFRIFLLCVVQGGADKSLARPTSQCHRTELIVSLERGVCSCAELQVFSCYRGWKEACQATRAISTTSRRELSSGFFPCKARHRRKVTPFWQKH